MLETANPRSTNGHPFAVDATAADVATEIERLAELVDELKAPAAVDQLDALGRTAAISRWITAATTRLITAEETA